MGGGREGGASEFERWNTEGDPHRKCEITSVIQS